MPQMTLLTGPERRRRWNEEDRCRILAAAFSPGAVVADVARRFDVATSLIYKWRRAYLTPSGFAPAVVVDAPALSAPEPMIPEPMIPEPMIPEPMIPEPQGPSILVELSNGTRVSVSATAPASLVTAALRALR